MESKIALLVSCFFFFAFIRCPPTACRYPPSSLPFSPLLCFLPAPAQIFGHLAVVGSVWEEDDPLRLCCLPYRQADLEVMPCTGLRGYPFLAQVCRKWKHLLATPMAQVRDGQDITARSAWLAHDMNE
jgi:hypothetical protein